MLVLRCIRAEKVVAVDDRELAMGKSSCGDPTPYDPLATSSFFQPFGETFKQSNYENWGNTPPVQLAPHASRKHGESRQARLMEHFSRDMLIIPSGGCRHPCRGPMPASVGGLGLGTRMSGNGSIRWLQEGT